MAEATGGGDRATDTGAVPGERGTAAEPTPGDRPRRTRIHHGELTSAGSALALLVLLFATKWYGMAGVPDPSAARPAVSTAIDGFHGLTGVRWVVLLTIAAALGSVVLHASQRSHGSRTDTSRPLAGLGALTSVLLIYRVLIALPSSGRVIDQKLGAFLGLLAALGITLGAQQSMLEQKLLAQAGPRRLRRRARVASRGEARE